MRPHPPHVPSSQITPESVYMDRRRFLALGGAALAASQMASVQAASAVDALAPLATRPGAYRTDEPPTPVDAVTGYNNFYEFGTG